MGKLAGFSGRAVLSRDRAENQPSQQPSRETYNSKRQPVNFVLVLLLVCFFKIYRIAYILQHTVNNWSQYLARKCVRGNQNTPASGEHFIFFYYKLFRGPTTLHPRRPHYTYTSNWARIFIYAPLHGWSMLFSERKNQRKRKKKKNSRVCRPEVVGSS